MLFLFWLWQCNALQEKPEVWVKDTSGFRVLVEAWGKHFSSQIRSCGADSIVCFLNFTVKGDATQVNLTGEYSGDSQIASAFLLRVDSEEVLQTMAGVEVDGGVDISIAWKPTVAQMSADGPCYAAYLASVRNSCLAFGDADLHPVSGSVSDVWLPAEVRAWVGGVWLTDIRDADVLYLPCSLCKRKLVSGICPTENCEGTPSEEKSALTTVTLADSTGCLYGVLIRTQELLLFTGLQTVDELEKCLSQEGHMSLPFRVRADVILGAQKATRPGAAQSFSQASAVLSQATAAQSLSPHVVLFEVLRVTPTLLAKWDTALRPLPQYVFQIQDESVFEDHTMLLSFYCVF